MKISTKIVLSNIIIVLFPLCAAIFAVFSISSLNKQVEDINKNYVQKILISSRYMELFQDHMRLLRELSITQDKITISEIENEMKNISSEANELMDYLTKNISSDAELKIITPLKTTRSNFLDSRQQYLNLIKEGDLTSAHQTYNKSLIPLQNDYRTLLTQYSQYEKKEIEKVQSDSQKKFSSSLTTLITLGIISVVVCIIMSIYLSSTIRKPIKNASNISQKIADGSMDAIDMKTINKDEFLPLFESLNVMITTISTVIDEIRKATKQLTDGVLSYRVDQSIFKGDYQLLIKEFNAAVEEMARPLRVITNFVDQLAKGEIPDLITSDEKGEYKISKDAINNLINTNKEIIGLATKISKGDINVQLAKRSADDKLVEALENMVQTLKYLMQDINEIAQNAANGKLDFEVDSSKYEGEFKDIIVSFLNTIESFKSPIKEMLNILQNLADGNLTQMMNGDYRGDFARLKDTTNATINSLNELIYQVQISAEEVSQGAMQVSAASQALSQGATEQAASLEEITSSTTQVASQTRVNAENAHQAQVHTNETK
ncbi:MAG TPA: MCP four helix bundle domain-containing protein, partial [Bacteroidota bacterium]|nr:MCP four helix bundle domain-containing protein [Bacteroidota bacterium]